MIIFKPDWIYHGDAQQTKGKKQCIYSVDVHPDGNRLATGSLDTTIKIWNTLPIYDEKAEYDSTCHKLLCTMTLHNGAVLCVRWSKDGRYLASSSDNDNVIIIWELDREATTGSVFGSNDVNHETWRAVKYLRGHNSDVQDLAWSHNHQYLASCGVDGFIIIWDARTFEQVHKIDQHTGFVKGITWDPVSKYLASQSDDKKVKIWRTSDWQEEAEIEGPFYNAPGTTFFSRLSWSPEGSHIAAANAVNGSQCVAAIINRDHWESDVSLVGHAMPVEVTAFNPKMFYVHREESSNEDDGDESDREEKKDDKPADEDTVMKDTETDRPLELVDVCALGGQDRGISIWMTGRSRPMCVARDLFENNVYDLSWTPDGTTLYACSQDGSVACIELKNEMKQPADHQDVLQRLEQYGYGRKHTMLPETPSQLDLEGQQEQEDLQARPSTSQRLESLMSGSQSDIRIGAGSSSMEVDGDQPASRDSVADITNTSSFSSSSSPSTTILEQKVTVTKDGKRRIQPVAVVKSLASNEPTSSAAASSSRTTALETLDHASPVANLRYDIPSLARGNRRRPDDDDPLLSLNGPPPASRFCPAWLDAAVPPPTASQIHLGAPKVKSSLLYRFDGDSQTAVIESHNPRSGSECAKVLLSKGGKMVWKDYLPHAVLLMTGNRQFSVVGCEDATIVVYSPAGRRLLPPIVLESTPVVLNCKNEWLLCLTETGLLYTWNILKQTCSLADVSVAPLLRVAQLMKPEDDEDDQPQPSPSLKDVRLQDNGTPLIVTSYHQVFAYSQPMRSWLRISDAWFILSEFWGSGHGDTLENHPLGWLSSALSKSGATDPTHDCIKSLANLDSQMAGTITLSHIENQLAACMVLGSAKEYKDWMKIYARRLSEENAHAKVQELCQWLVGPPFM
ncbi:WD40 repeat-like protein [Hesseltinella vesiculosa]|uniref:Protein HIR n=1 Tax=Hesseltinella vesiculosa TaxID=101127 RepID=A0A1X2GM37_9FUNG|nr:WD40 repeat-like protein [Hesseltinella vesiculosa]